MIIVWSSILVNVNSWVLEKQMKMRYLPIMKYDLKKLLIDENLNFNEHLTNVCKSASRKLYALSRVSSLLSYQQKKVVSSSFISEKFSYCPLIWTFSSIRSYRKISKLHERSLRLCHNDYTSSYDELLSKQDLVNIHIRNIQQLMIEIFKCLKGISPPIMNEIFRLRNIPYTIRNPRDLDSRLPKTVYCGLETIAYKGPQIWPPLGIVLGSPILEPTVIAITILSIHIRGTLKVLSTHLESLETFHFPEAEQVFLNPTPIT